MGRIAISIGDRNYCAQLCAAALLALASLFVPGPAKAEPLLISEESSHWQVHESMEISQSIPAETPIASVLSGNFSETFEPTSNPVPNLSGRDGPVWVKLAITNTSDSMRSARLVFKFPQAQAIDFFVENSVGGYSHSALGSAIALVDEPNGRFPNAPVMLAAGQTKTAFLRVTTSGPALIPLQLYDEDAFIDYMLKDFLIFGLLVGIVLAIAIHSGLTFVTTREAAFGWFVIFAFCAAGYILSATGIAKAYFWPGLAFNSNSLLFLVQGLSNAASAMFLASYLDTANKMPRLHRIILSIAAACALSSFAAPMPDLLAQALFGIGLLIGPPVLFAITLTLTLRKVEGAQTLLLGWTMIQIGTVWIYFRVFDIVPYTEFNHYALPLAVTFTALQFSWALTSRARKAEHQATHDVLTGLPNRLRLAMVGNQSSSFRRRLAAVWHVDLDGFKRVNDTFGHSAGDAVLKEVSNRIARTTDEFATAFRTGGDEFVIMCDSSNDARSAITLAQVLINEISKPIHFRGKELNVGASIGMAIPRDRAEPVSDIIERADQALYSAKRAGKGRVSLCDLTSERAMLAEIFAEEENDLPKEAAA